MAMEISKISIEHTSSIRVYFPASYVSLLDCIWSKNGGGVTFAVQIIQFLVFACFCCIFVWITNRTPWNLPRKKTFVNFHSLNSPQSMMNISAGGVFFWRKTTRWSNVTFLSPSWRSLNFERGHLTIPKRARLQNCWCKLRAQEQMGVVCFWSASSPSTWLLFYFIFLFGGEDFWTMKQHQ